MDAIAKPTSIETDRPSRHDAEEAVKTLLRYIGEDPRREGLIDTPRRTVNALADLYSGYDRDADDVLGRTFEEVSGYDEIVVLRDIELNSHCEHHMLPITGRVTIAYLPAGRVVGLSKLVHVVNIYGRRLQTQETLTAQIAHTIQDVLAPRGVAVFVRAEHSCMVVRGVRAKGTETATSLLTGVFRDDPEQRTRLFETLQAIA